MSHELKVFGMAIDFLLQWIDYDAVDYDDQWDRAGRDDEERWFDDEEAD